MSRRFHRQDVSRHAGHRYSLHKLCLSQDRGQVLLRQSAQIIQAYDKQSAEACASATPCSRSSAPDTRIDQLRLDLPHQELPRPNYRVSVFHEPPEWSHSSSFLQEQALHDGRGHFEVRSSRTSCRTKITEAGVRRRAEFFYQQLDALQALRQQVRRDLLAECRNHSARKLLRQIPSIGPIRAALLIALIQTPHRFRTKRQLWAYSGLAIETHDSAQYRYVAGQLQRSKKPQQLRGLNRNHNHDLKAIFKGAATKASSGAGPFHDFYQALFSKGMRPSMARLTLARKIAAITLIVWKKGAHFDVEQLKPQAA
jgi:Transposase IS116/IS110/IS902 family